MRFYGRNRARMLGEEVERQEPVERRDCAKCGANLPPSEFGNGRFRLCQRCRDRQKVYDMRRRRRKEGK